MFNKPCFSLRLAKLVHMCCFHCVVLLYCTSNWLVSMVGGDESAIRIHDDDDDQDKQTLSPSFHSHSVTIH